MIFISREPVFFARLSVVMLALLLCPLVLQAQQGGADEPGNQTSNAEGEVPPEPLQANDVAQDVEREALDDLAPAKPGTPSNSGQASAPSLNKSSADQLNDLPDFGSALIRMVSVLVAMIVLMLVLAKLLPRWLSRRGPSVGKRMRVVDRMQVEPGRSLLVVYVGGQYLLMASDAEGLRVVAQDAIDQDALRDAFDADADAADADSRKAKFSTLLNASRSVGDEPSGPRATGKEAAT